MVDFLLAVGTLLNGFDSLAVALRDGAHIVGAASAPFNLQHLDTCFHYLVEEANGTEVLGRHDILVVYLQLQVALLVLDDVSAAAQLEAGTAVGRVVVVVEREVAFAADAHTQGSVGKYLHLHQLAFGAADVLVADKLRDFRYLPQRQFAGRDDDVGKPGVVAHCLGVGDIALGGDMHLETYLVGIGDDGHVGGDDGAHTGLLGSMQQSVHLVYFFIIYNGVDGEIGADARLLGYAHYAWQVADGEVGRRAGTHVQFAHAEINGVGATLDGGVQALVRAHGAHDFNLIWHTNP